MNLKLNINQVGKIIDLSVVVSYFTKLYLCFIMHCMFTLVIFFFKITEKRQCADPFSYLAIMKESNNVVIITIFIMRILKECLEGQCCHCDPTLSDIVINR